MTIVTMTIVVIVFYYGLDDLGAFVGFRVEGSGA